MMCGFQTAIADAGFTPPDYIEPGKFHRYAGLDKKPSNRSGYCKLFDDCKAGIFGDFSTGFKQTWFDGNSRELTLNERMKLQDQIRVAKGHREADEAIIRGDVADEAQMKWPASAPVTNHPYPIRKRFIPFVARQDGNALLVPMYFSGRLVNLQRIYTNTEGNNKFPIKGGRVKGCYCPVGKIVDFVYICEGFATACSLHEYTGKPIIIAFNADGLKTVALAVRKKYPDLKITIACDNDAETELRTGVNPGLEKGRAAAAAVDGDVIMPVFDEGQTGTDFNDYLNQGGEL